MSNSIGEKFKLIRGITGLSQTSFAEFVGVPSSSYKKYEGGHSEVGAPALLAVANHPELKKYALWLITGETNPEAGQYAPGDQIIDEGTLSNEQFEQQAIEALAQSQLMFCHLGWFKPNEDKLDEKLFDECGAISLNSIKPLISAKYGNESKTKSA